MSSILGPLEHLPHDSAWTQTTGPVQWRIEISTLDHKLNWPSNEFCVVAESGYGLRKLLSCQAIQVGVNILGWVLEAGAMMLGCRTNMRRSQVDKRREKIIRMLRFDAECLHAFDREVAHVVGHDHCGTTANRGRQDMTVIRVRQ